jgi:hypothetical protein
MMIFERNSMKTGVWVEGFVMIERGFDTMKVEIPDEFRRLEARY